MYRKSRIKWTRQTITSEFGKDSRTVGKMLHQAGMDNLEVLTTPQVFAAMMGDLTSERIRETREKADKLEMENKFRRRELVEVKEFTALMVSGLESIKATIISSANLEEEDKDKLLRACQDSISRALGVAGRRAAGSEPATTADG